MSATDITEPLAQSAQAAAVVIGGTWAYAKYLRGRVFRPRAELVLSTSPIRSTGNALIVVHVSMKNQGLARLRLERDLSMVLVDSIPDEDLHPGINVRWKDSGMAAPVFEHHGWLEPGETINDEVLMPLPYGAAPQPVAYRVRAWVRAPRRLRRTGVAWSANAILTAPSLAAFGHDPHEGNEWVGHR